MFSKLSTESAACFAYLLRALKPLLQLHAQLVGRQAELRADPLRPRRAGPEAEAGRRAGERAAGGAERQPLWSHGGQL